MTALRRVGECDLCQQGPRRLHFVIIYGLDTYVCSECLGRDDDEEDATEGEEGPATTGR